MSNSIARAILPGLLALSGLLGAPVAHGADRECERIEQRFDASDAGARDYYGMAYCAARAGRAEQAFAYLDQATQRGYHEFEQLRTDPDFSALHADARWAPVLAAVEQAQRVYLGQVNAEVLEIYNADQADRKGDVNDWAAIMERDRARYQRIRALADSGQLRHGDDYLRAAMVFQHGDTPEAFLQAQQWALRAMELDPGNRPARWLACAAEDRYLQAVGKPQIWGTQYQKPKGGKWSMEPFDRTQKTDAQRIAMGVPPLAESAAIMERWNAAGK